MGRIVRKLKMGLAALILCGSLLPPACAKGEVPRELSQLYAHSARPDGWRQRAYFVWKKGGGSASHGQYHQDHDLYPGSGTGGTG